MNLDRPLFGRVTINAKKIDLGRANLTTLFLRASESIRMTRNATEINLVLEMSHAKLPDSTLLTKEVIVEQAFAAHIQTDLTADSPFEGLTIGRVTEAMESTAYTQYAHLCNPDNRVGVSQETINRVIGSYMKHFADCALHFPKWIDS